MSKFKIGSIVENEKMGKGRVVVDITIPEHSVVQFENLEHIVTIHDDRLKLVEPEQSKDKYERRQKLWLPMIVDRRDDAGDYHVFADFAFTSGHRPTHSTLCREEDLRPRFDEPENKEFKADDLVWVKGRVVKPLDDDGYEVDTLDDDENYCFYYDFSQLKHRAEDE